MEDERPTCPDESQERIRRLLEMETKLMLRITSAKCASDSQHTVFEFSFSGVRVLVWSLRSFAFRKEKDTFLYSTVLIAISNQVRPPAELKHITKRRKRN